MTSESLKKELEEKIAKAREEIQKRIDIELNERKKAVENQIKTYEAEGLQKLNNEKQKVIAKKEEIEKKKAEIGSRVNKLKKAAEDKIKKGVPEDTKDKIKDLF